GVLECVVAIGVCCQTHAIEQRRLRTGVGQHLRGARVEALRALEVERFEQLTLGSEVLIERARRVADRLGDGAHRESRGAVPIDQLAGGVEDRSAHLVAMARSPAPGPGELLPLVEAQANPLPFSARQLHLSTRAGKLKTTDA